MCQTKFPRHILMPVFDWHNRTKLRAIIHSEMTDVMNCLLQETLPIYRQLLMMRNVTYILTVAYDEKHYLYIDSCL